jgi:hypothetical protein
MLYKKSQVEKRYSFITWLVTKAGMERKRYSFRNKCLFDRSVVELFFDDGGAWLILIRIEDFFKLNNTNCRSRYLTGRTNGVTWYIQKAPPPSPSNKIYKNVIEFSLFFI